MIMNFGAKGAENHLEERLLDQAQVRASNTPPFLGSFALLEGGWGFSE